MNADRIQGWSRSLIFLGLIFLSSVLASIVGMGFCMVLFDDLVTGLSGGSLPTDTSSWWQLHVQNFFSQAIGFGAVAWMAMRLWGRAALVGLPGRPIGRHLTLLLLATVATVVSGPLLMASYELNAWLIPEGGLLESWFKPTEDMLEELIAFMASGDGVLRRAVIVFSIAALPGIFEELSFRGVLQPLLIRATGSAFWGIAIASLVFSAIHFQFYGFLPRVLLGALFGWLAHRTGSLIPGMVAHFVNNALAAVTLWVTGSMTEDILELTPVVLLTSTALTIASVYGVNRVIQGGRPA